jgi:hypothetical protein
MRRVEIKMGRIETAVGENVQTVPPPGRIRNRYRGPFRHESIVPQGANKRRTVARQGSWMPSCLAGDGFQLWN